MQRARWAGMIGSSLFVTAFILQDLLRPDFNEFAAAVSEHSIGPGGWIQITNFVVTGILFLAFARGTAREFRDGNGARLGAGLLMILGWCLLLSGPFVADPAPVTILSSDATWHGRVHAILGAIAFTLMPLSCFAFYLRFRREARWSAFATPTLAACLTILLAIAQLKAAQLGLLPGLAGLFQRIALVAFFGWTFAFAWKLL